MEILVLASGSSGNAAVVRSGRTSVLVDVGISALAVRRRMEAFGVSPSELDGVLLTHEHTDHVRGLRVLLKRHRLPVWATNGTWSGVEARATSGGELSSGRRLRVGCLDITPVSTSHDAREPVAMILDDGSCRAAIMTDTGVVTGLLKQRLSGCRLLLVEANHDADLLRRGPYPWPLKQRIASRLGHLANHQLREALTDLVGPQLEGVVGMHLSEQNNQPELVRHVLGESVGESVGIGVATRSQMVRISIAGADDDPGGAGSQGPQSGRPGVAVEHRPAPPGRRRSGRDQA